MRLLTPARRFEAEQMDSPDVAPEALRGNLRDLAQLNRRFGGTDAVVRPLRRLARHCHVRGPIRILDLGTGSADIPRALAAGAMGPDFAPAVVAVDINPVMLELARAECREFPNITIERQDLLALPYADRSFDFVIGSQVLHHFREDDAIRVLRKAARIARHGIVMADLRRGRLAHAIVWLAARLMSANPVTRNDAPASIMNSFTRRELAELAVRAGLRGSRVLWQPFCRMALVGRVQSA